MATRISSQLRITPFLLLVGIAMTSLSAFFFILLDQVVHRDLYRYGLQFSYEWAGQYWSYSRLIIGFSAATVVLTGLSITLIFVKGRTQKNDLGFVIIMLLVAAMASAGLSAFFFSRLDYIVHNDLYRYGLQFNYEWATQYWTYAKLILGLLGATISTSSSSIVLILRSLRIVGIQGFLTRGTPRKIDSRKLVHCIFFSVGAVALVFSIIYTSSILAFTGLGLVFWGAILAYIRPERYVKETLLGKTISPSLAALCQVITELGYKGKGIYLPPKYFKEFESSKVYITRQGDMRLPSPSEIQEEQDRVFLKNPDAVLIQPPGVELTRLFEKTLGTSFTMVDLRYLQQKVPKLLVEDLEIAQNIEMETGNSKVLIRIENSIYRDMCEETGKLPEICLSIGCPLCSAFACALAKATGKPIIIEGQQTSEDERSIETEYGILEEGE